MHRNVPRTEEKVDGLLMPMDERNSYLAVYNVNLPVRMFDTVGSSTAALERTKNLLAVDFANANAMFQFTASYLLYNEATAQYRTWTGSFYPRGNAPAYLSAFRRFDPATFVAFGLASVDNVEQSLTSWTREDTNWAFSDLISIIVNVQSVVPATHPIVSKFPNSTHGRKRQIVFALP